MWFEGKAAVAKERKLRNVRNTHRETERKRERERDRKKREGREKVAYFFLHITQ